MENKELPDVIKMEWEVDPYRSATSLLMASPVGYRVNSIDRKGSIAMVTYVKVSKVNPQ